MRRNMMVFSLAVFLIPLLSVVVFAGTIHLPESMKNEAYGLHMFDRLEGIGVQSADPLENWHLVNPLFEGGNITALAVGNGAIVALVDTGTTAKIVKTTNGEDWSTVHSICGAKPYAVLFVPGATPADGKFVAVGQAMISDSSDAVNWTDKYSGGSDIHWDVAYGKGTAIPDGKYVAVGNAGKIMTSDGNLWTTIPNTDPTTLTKDLLGVAYGNDKFVAIGKSCKIRTSTDGSQGSWSTLLGTGAGEALPPGCKYTASTGAVTGPDLKSITFGNNRFVVTTTADIIYTSADGLQWEKDFAVLAHNLNKVTFLNNNFIAVGSYGTILSSPDGLTWTVENFSETSDPSLTGIGMALDGKTYIVVGKGIIMTSADLASSNWKKWTLQASNILNSVTYGSKKFITAGDSLTVQTSSDADLWTREVWGGGTSAYHFKGIAFGKVLDQKNPPALVNGFVAVGGSTSEDLIITSPDGHTWTETDLGASVTTTSGTPPVTVTRLAKLLYGITYADNIFVAVGASGTIMTSPNADTWTLKSKEEMPDDTVTLYGVAYGGPTGDKKFVTVGSNAKCFTSQDGDTWTAKPVTAGTTVTLYGIAYGGPVGNEVFIAVGYDSATATKGGKIYNSTDGITWTPVASLPLVDPVPALYGIFWDIKTKNFLAVGDKATILSSPDGINWTVMVNDPDLFPSAGAGTGTAILRSIAYGNNVYVAVGNVAATYAKAGFILKSDPLVPPAVTNIRATSTSTGTIMLAWDDKTNEKDFQIYRKKDTAAATLLKTVSANTTTYTDATAAGNSSTTAYSYYLKTRNTRSSAASKTVIVPFQPTGLAATATTGRIALNWTDVTNDTGYEIYRKPGDCSAGGTWSLAGTVAKDIVAFNNTGLAAAKTYSYKIRSFNRTALPYSYGYSMYSSCVSKTTP
jgi:hypothetical protein